MPNVRQTPLRLAAGFLALFALYHLPELLGRTLLASALAMGLFPVATWAVLRGLFGAPLAAAGLGRTPRRGVQLALGLLTGLAFGLLSLGISTRAGFEAPTREMQLADLTRLPLMLVMTFFPSLAEDLLTRGYLFFALAGRLRPAPWVVLSAVVYVLNHLHRLGDGPPVLLYLFALGLSFALALVRTRALWLTLGLHWGGNVLYQLSVEALEVSGTDPVAAQWVHAAVLALLFVVLALALPRSQRVVVHPGAPVAQASTQARSVVPPSREPSGADVPPSESRTP
jgi:membrane protease YdiL (CAAX protease family)